MAGADTLSGVATSDTGPPIAGAAIGAGGAVLAQTVSAIFTARRESARLKWEMQRQDAEWELRKDERFLAVRRELYVSFSAVADRLLGFINELLAREELSDEHRQQQVPEMLELDRLQSSIALVAPREVEQEVRKCNLNVMRAIDLLASHQRAPDDERAALARDAHDAWWAAQWAMRDDLQGTQEYFQREKEVPPSSPDPPPRHFGRHPALGWKTVVWKIRHLGRNQES